MRVFDSVKKKFLNCFVLLDILIPVQFLKNQEMPELSRTFQSKKKAPGYFAQHSNLKSYSHQAPKF